MALRARRCRAGELLQEIEPATGAHLKREGNLPLSRETAATEAGLSEHQRKTALRVANVPVDPFEQQVESDAPPSTFNPHPQQHPPQQRQ
jgi:hypothetical protein